MEDDHSSATNLQWNSRYFSAYIVPWIVSQEGTCFPLSLKRTGKPRLRPFSASLVRVKCLSVSRVLGASANHTTATSQCHSTQHNTATLPHNTHLYKHGA